MGRLRLLDALDFFCLQTLGTLADLEPYVRRLLKRAIPGALGSERPLDCSLSLPDHVPS